MIDKVQMGLDRARLEAALCWDLASNLSPDSSPLMEELRSKLRGFMGREKPSVKMTQEELGAKCDQLIRVEDASVRVMTLLAIYLMRYRSQHVGLISTFMASKEYGQLINPQNGEPFQTGACSLSDSSHRYLLSILDFRKINFWERLEKTVGHWMGVLDMYAGEYHSPELYRDTLSDWGETITTEEAKEKALEHYRKSLEYFQFEVRDIFARIGLDVGILKRREAEIRMDLHRILAYNFTANQSPLITEAALNELAVLAGMGVFPGHWLVEAADEVSRNLGKFSNQLELLLV